MNQRVGVRLTTTQDAKVVPGPFKFRPDSTVYGFANPQPALRQPALGRTRDRKQGEGKYPSMYFKRWDTSTNCNVVQGTRASSDQYRLDGYSMYLRVYSLLPKVWLRLCSSCHINQSLTKLFYISR